MNLQHDPTVSIIIPTCNRLTLLKRALLCVQNQDYKNLVQIIVTDDSSNNETELYVSEISKQDPRVVYIKNVTYEKGPSGNKQNGIDYATGYFVGTFDDDDELFPDAVSSMIDVYVKLGYRHILANCTRSTDGELSGKSYGISEEVSYKDILTGRYNGEYFGIFARDLLKNYKLADDTWGGESVLWWQLFKQEPAYYLHKIVRVYHVDLGTNVSDHYIKHSRRTFLSYKYRVDLFEQDLLAYAPKQYQKYALLAAFFASLDFDYGNVVKYIYRAWVYTKKTLFLVSFTLFILIPLPKKLKGRVYEFAKRRYLKS